MLEQTFRVRTFPERPTLVCCTQPSPVILEPLPKAHQALFCSWGQNCFMTYWSGHVSTTCLPSLVYALCPLPCWSHAPLHAESCNRVPGPGGHACHSQLEPNHRMHMLLLLRCQNMPGRHIGHLICLSSLSQVVTAEMAWCRCNKLRMAFRKAWSPSSYEYIRFVTAVW
jgi:hypothetical protein